MTIDEFAVFAVNVAPGLPESVAVQFCCGALKVMSITFVAGQYAAAATSGTGGAA